MSWSRTEKDGTIIWEDEEGRFHRKDGPAYIFPNGGEQWFLHGQLHREDGPAIITSDRLFKAYYLNGKRLSKEEYFQQLSKEQKFKWAFKLDEL